MRKTLLGNDSSAGSGEETLGVDTPHFSHLSVPSASSRPVREVAGTEGYSRDVGETSQAGLQERHG